MNDNVALGLKRAVEMGALFAIGDGVMGLLQPERHVKLWRSDAPAVDGLVKSFDGHPGRRRAYSLLQIAGGLLVAHRLRR